jgi:hypothetical protein
VELFAVQAWAMGLHIANLVALDPLLVVLGDGLWIRRAPRGGFGQRC